MDEMDALERQLADVVRGVMRPPRPVDAAAIVRTATSDDLSGRWSVITRRVRGGASAPVEGGFDMSSALKFVAAGVIVALFGGFLLAGVFTTQQGDEVPAAVTESPSPTTSDDWLSGMVTVEIEPGVFGVVHDGVRNLAKANNTDIVAGHDDGIWLLRPQRFVRLGDDEWHEWDEWDEWRESPGQKPDLRDFEVAPDGTVWVQADQVIVSFDGEDWTTHDTMSAFEFASDGTLWAMWQDPETWQELFGYLDEDGWQALGRPDGAWQLHVAGPDDIWALRGGGMIFPPYVVRFVDGAWQTLVGVEGTEATWQRLEDFVGSGTLAFAGVWGLGPDGTFWGVDGPDLVRFDGTEWSRWPLKDTGVGPSRFEVAPDGSVWSSRWRKGADECAGGVAHFDGVTRDRYLPGPCVEAIDITADGSVWVLDEEGDLYVIRPEAVAAAE